MHRFYVFKWWLLSVCLIGPLIILITSLFTGTHYTVAIWAVPFGLMFSLPCLLFMLPIFYFLHKWKTGILATKLILNITAITGILVTFHIFLSEPENIFPAIYIASVIISSLFCRLAEEDDTIVPSDTHSPRFIDGPE